MLEGVPRLWNETIRKHRDAVHDAILETTWALVTEHGLMSVTMTHIAEQVGIGRATLYKYFQNVEAILLARHERLVSQHLERLTELSEQDAEPGERLDAVVTAYAFICHHRGQHGTGELAALLHRPEHVAHAEQRLTDLFRGLLREVEAAGDLRDDVPVDELATYCLHALTAAGAAASEDAVHRLVEVTLAGLRPPRRSP